MATYKVLQDIEAEDRLIGPLTPKQFLYAGVSAAWIFAGYMVASRTNMWLLAIFIIPILPIVYLATPLGRDQPNDIWLLAKLNYWLRPRTRTWAQGSYTNLIVIQSAGGGQPTPAAPAPIDSAAVGSRLKSLAAMLDEPHIFADEVIGPPNLSTTAQTPVTDPFIVDDDNETANRLDQLLVDQASRTRVETYRSQPNQGLEAPPATKPPEQSDIIETLAGTDDLNVATIARLADKRNQQSAD